MTAAGSAIDEMVNNCLAVRVRLINRVVTAVYDRAIESSGLTISQLNLLAAVGKIGPCSPSKLGAVLQLERSSVSRNLDRLLKAGWLRAVSSDEKGLREIALTASGRRKVEAVMPQWRQAQNEAGKLLGQSAVNAVRGVVDGMWRLPAS